MLFGDAKSSARSVEKIEVIEKDRRRFLSLIPLAVFGVIAASVGGAAKKFLEPAAAAAESTEAAAGGGWLSLGMVKELTGDDPIERVVAVERNAGWTKSIEDATVFVLPKHDNKVLSSVCPHEGCPVVWDAETKNFLCPCHDSYFSDCGSKLSGPSTTNLTELETRVADGELQVKV